MRSRYCKQIWQALRSAILVALVHVNVVIIQLHKEEYKWRANTVKIFCDIVRLFGQLVILYCKNLFNPPSMSNTTAWYKLSNVFTSRTTPTNRLIYSRVVWCIHESYNPCPSLGRLPFFLPHTTDDLMKSFTFKELSPIKCNTYKNLDKTTLSVKTLAITNASNKFEWMMILDIWNSYIFTVVKRWN